jgi:HPt (histidine-containing phosphotransfer) domain-containing protein
MMGGASDGPAYDRNKLVELFGDDAATLAEVERDFLETARGAEKEIAGTEDCDAIARAAHRLKGASGMIGAAALGQLAESLEKAAKAFDLKTVRRLHGDFRREVERVARQVGV